MDTVILITGFFEKIILVFMIGLSIWSVSIMIEKRRLLKACIDFNEFEMLKQKILTGDLTSLKMGTSFFSNGVTLMLNHKARNPELIPENVVQLIDRSVSHFLKENRQNLNQKIYILASLGSNAPFIGLFGTVLGIIRAFAYLGSQSGSAAVMSGVSQALYATAVGLLVAIPAVTAYNYFSQQIKKAMSSMEYLRDLFVANSVLQLTPLLNSSGSVTNSTNVGPKK